MALLTASPALSAYEALASTYDIFTADHEHDLWLERLEALARQHGLSGHRVLDVGCGTGKSAAPLLRRGYATSACDLSPSMAAIAQQRLGPTADVFVADMRDLPDRIGPFDLVTCLDDAINYLQSVDDLRASFASVARVLDPDGLYVFDVNTLLAYRTSFSHDFVAEMGDTVFCWRGDGEAGGEPEPDGCHAAQLDAFVPEADGRFSRRTSKHVQRHFSDAAIQAALAASGLSCVDVVGQSPGVRLSRPVDESVHYKRLYVARAAA
jgi:SAM-dependent methyltransferase